MPVSTYGCQATIEGVFDFIDSRTKLYSPQP